MMVLNEPVGSLPAVRLTLPKADNVVFVPTVTVWFAATPVVAYAMPTDASP